MNSLAISHDRRELLPKCNSNHKTGVSKHFTAMAIGKCKAPTAIAALSLTTDKKHGMSQPGSKAERSAAELHRGLGAVLHAHIARSDQLGEIVASHGLTGLY
jgi:hypothetical protein